MKNQQVLEEAKKSIKTEFCKGREILSANDLLKLPIAAVIGISDVISNTLKNLPSVQIATIFDLASSAVFAHANELCAASNQVDHPFVVQNNLPSTILSDEALAQLKRHEFEITQLADQGIRLLLEFSNMRAEDITNFSKASNIYSIRDLANWVPYRMAHALHKIVLNRGLDSKLEDDVSQKFRPTKGEQPAGQITYTRLVLDIMKSLSELKSLDKEGGISVGDFLNAQNTGFKGIGFGALVSFQQDWYNIGQTCGALINSINLAPGETTKQGNVDWDRSELASFLQHTKEIQSLINQLSGSRFVGEVTNAVLTEQVKGSSTISGGGNANLGGQAKGGKSAPGKGKGSSSGNSNFDFNGTSSSQSFGQRDLSGSMLQAINEQTKQTANSKREANINAQQQKHELEKATAKTNVIANYNRIYPLNLLYYAIHEIHRIVTRVSKVEPCLFIPVKPINFKDPSTMPLIMHNAGVLAQAALLPEIKNKLLRRDESRIVVRFPTQNATILASRNIALAERSLNAVAASASVMAPSAASVVTNNSVAKPTAAAAAAPAAVATAAATRIPILSSARRAAGLKERPWTQVSLSNINERLKENVILDHSDNAYAMKDTVELVSIGSTADMACEISIYEVGKEQATSVKALPAGQEIYLDRAIQLNQVSKINIKKQDGTESVTKDFVLNFRRLGTIFPITVSTTLRGQIPVSLLTAEALNNVDVDLLAHLQEHSAHYSQAIYNAMDETSGGYLLASYSYAGAPLIDLGNDAVPLLHAVDPKPLRLCGNSIVFRLNPNFAPAFNAAWNDWLRKHGFDQDISTEIYESVPTQGQYLEGLLGNIPVAEQYDATRHISTTWQGVNIPIETTPIAPINLGTPTSSTNNIPIQAMPQPVLTQMLPPSFPAPDSIEPTIKGVTTKQPFGDPSGASALAGLLQVLLGQLGQTAQTGAQTASTNMATGVEYAKQLTDMMKTVASMVTGVPVGGTGTSATGAPQGQAVGGSGTAPSSSSVQSGLSNPANALSAASNPLVGNTQSLGSAAGANIPVEGSGVSASGNQSSGLVAAGLGSSIFTPVSASTSGTNGSAPVTQSPLYDNNTLGLLDWSRSITVKIRVFIPSPIVIGNFGGDNRGPIASDGTSRLDIFVQVFPDSNLYRELPGTGWGTSHKYNSSDTAHVDGKPYWWYDLRRGAQAIQEETLSRSSSNLRISTETADNGTALKVSYSGANPLLSVAPPIDGNLTIFIGQNGLANITGSHDGFPQHTVFINDELVYNFDPVAANSGPGKLFGSSDITVQILSHPIVNFASGPRLLPA